VTVNSQITVFWDVMSSSLVDRYKRLKEHTVPSSNMQTEIACFSKILVSGHIQYKILPESELSLRN
jgi:hypothetical protein